MSGKFFSFNNSLKKASASFRVKICPGSFVKTSSTNLLANLSINSSPRIL